MPLPHEPTPAQPEKSAADDDESTPPYGGGASQTASGAGSAGTDSTSAGTAGAVSLPPRRVRTLDLIKAKSEGRRWAMLTSYDQYTAALFEQAGVEVLLVGDSAANNVYGHETTLPVTVDELIPLARAVSSATSRALIVADLPFGSYEISDEQAVATAVRFMKEAGVHAVKLEGGAAVATRIKAITTAGIPVMAHIGFTPQAEHNLGGYKVQGRGDAGNALLADARAVAEAGAFSVVMEMVPAGLAGRVSAELAIPTVGIGAGADCDAQVLVWQDMAGLRTGKAPRFVKRYADLHSVLFDAVGRYVDEVKSGEFPEPERSFD
ncbi:ketopantoate hydroxymethyltransferase [Brevibacterium antiquum]|uniref:3-methyl-2-oxobutanoate hydroxymethyltransferase n=3 Tax=Brevibacteriaceae TaxID=85019 RepID=A0A2H1KT23_9MICO|nr:ketopantoate hydroxymethyltransferase [Brevibacterium antiquum]SMY02684.1 ketopantoate hydroxymethyltransferase [Brevibacterium antiquum CNRZ 918]